MAFGLTGASPGEARQWSRTPAALAQDYAVIADNRGAGDVVMLMWLSAATLPDTPTTKIARDLIDKYVVLGIVHGHTQKDGAATFDKIAPPAVSDADKKPLVELDESALAPAMVGMLAMLKAGSGSLLGNLGRGVQWFVYDSGTVRSCARGGLLVAVESETYTYETPFPGCP